MSQCCYDNKIADAIGGGARVVGSAVMTGLLALASTQGSNPIAVQNRVTVLTGGDIDTPIVDFGDVKNLGTQCFATDWGGLCLRSDECSHKMNLLTHGKPCIPNMIVQDVSKGCKAFYQTGQCKDNLQNGHEKRNSCLHRIPNGISGVCKCFDGSEHGFGCQHQEQTCSEVCMKNLKCENLPRETEGTCRLFGCDENRGPTKCDENKKCVCEDGNYSTGEVCVALPQQCQSQNDSESDDTDTLF